MAIDFKSDPVIDHMPLITGVLVLGSCEHEAECCNWPTYIPWIANTLHLAGFHKSYILQERTCAMCCQVLTILYNPHRAFYVWVLVEQSFCEKPRHSTKKLDLITELLIINVLPKAHRNAWVRPQNLSQMEFTNSNNLLLCNSTSDNLITYVNKTCAIMHTTNDSIEF